MLKALAAGVLAIECCNSAKKNEGELPVWTTFAAMDQQILIDLVTKKMPYGKYKGRLLCDVPEHYLVWMHGQGFPEGKLGMWLHTLYEIRLNGLEGILAEVRTCYE